MMMMMIKSAWIEKGISKKVASQAAGACRKSTLSSYDARVRIFYKWCDERNLAPLQTSVAQVADFLEHLFESGLQYRIISGYRAAISIVTQAGRERRLVVIPSFHS